ncbi:molecular chaperone [Alloalcanivorax sp. C16-2]|uniref:fimbrial biogenesis chaperone n=1 Tax=Alloalcanivorax sp. C16-2 TaxID=3390052 RepID=UPI00397055FF
MVAWAGGMRVTPILQALPHDRAMAVYRIHNLRDAPLTVQIRAWRWQREAGGRQLEDAPDLLVVPPLVTLAPGQQQLVRIARRGADRDRELAYRVRFQEIAERSAGAGLAVGTTVTMDVPLFLLAPAPRKQSEWRVIRDGGEPRLRITNTGNRYLRLPSLTVSAGDGPARSLGAGAQYVLIGETREWVLPLEPSDLGEGLTVHYQEKGRMVSRRLASP